jgi:hypothetical protein
MPRRCGPVAHLNFHPFPLQFLRFPALSPISTPLYLSHHFPPFLPIFFWDPHWDFKSNMPGNFMGLYFCPVHDRMCLLMVINFPVVNDVTGLSCASLCSSQMLLCPSHLLLVCCNILICSPQIVHQNFCVLATGARCTISTLRSGTGEDPGAHP